MIQSDREWILNTCFDTAGNKLNRWKSKEALEYLISNEGDTYGEKVYRVLHNIECECKCPCGNKLEFRGFQHGYAKFCSRNCAGKYTASKQSLTKKTLFSDDDYKSKFLSKQRSTKLELYGEPYFNNRSKAKETCIHKYGVDNPSHISYVIDKIISTKRDNSPFEDGYIQTHLDIDVITCLNNAQWLRDSLSVCGVYELASILNISVTTIYKRCENFNIEFDSKVSEFENEVFYFISSIYDGEIVRNDRSILEGKELDIYIPEKKVAIECNGVHWHSESVNNNRNYHLNKTNDCEYKGIQLFHIFDNEWHQNKELWKSVLENKLGASSVKVGARKTDIRTVSYEHYCGFVMDNHLQGVSFTPIVYGLYYNDELLSIMSFSKSRFTDADYELQRFCSKRGYRVQGGASKLLSHFKKNHTGTIVSYANRRWSDGGLYRTLGFEFKHTSSPNYFYFRDHGNSCNVKLESRNKYQKHKLKGIFDNYDSNITEYQNMLNNGYSRIWDSGNMVYFLDI